MDCSKDYILMCEKATEIQALRRRLHGAKCNLDKIGHGLGCEDVFFFPDWRGEDFYNDYLGSKDTGLLSIFLPRQDQLQEMIKLPTWKLIYEFILWFSALMEVEAEPIWKQNSMEQLWLSFVMEKVYGKRWEGHEWKKVEYK